MQALDEQIIYCPYCGEAQSVLIDLSVNEQEYIEDCQICCRPINFSLIIDEEDNIQLSCRHENE